MLTAADPPITRTLFVGGRVVAAPPSGPALGGRPAPASVLVALAVAVAVN